MSYYDPLENYEQGNEWRSAVGGDTDRTRTETEERTE